MIILDINGIKHFLCMNAYNDISISIIISFLLRKSLALLNIDSLV